MGRKTGPPESTTAGLDAWLPDFDVREYHERETAAPPERALAAALALPADSDRFVGLLLRMRGFDPAYPLERFFPEHGFRVVEQSETVYVTVFDWRGISFAFDLRARARPGGGSLLTTETRVLTPSRRARVGFGAYWLVVHPFSALIRRRWLAAAARSLAQPHA